MDMLDMIVNLKAGADEIAFVVAIGILSFFYTAYKQCDEELEKEKMLEQFLNE